MFILRNDHAVSLIICSPYPSLQFSMHPSLRVLSPCIFPPTPLLHRPFPSLSFEHPHHLSLHVPSLPRSSSCPFPILSFTSFPHFSLHVLSPTSPRALTTLSFTLSITVYIPAPPLLNIPLIFLQLLQPDGVAAGGRPFPVLRECLDGSGRPPHGARPPPAAPSGGAARPRVDGRPKHRP